MGEYFTLVWDWLGDEDHRARLLAIITALGFIGGFLAWFFGLFKRKPDPQPVQQPLTTLPTDQPVMLMTKAAFEAELQAKAEEVEAALATASEDERARLEGQRAEIARRLADVEGALKAREAKVRELEALLDREGNKIGGDRLAEARAALEQGDFSKADDLFAEIEAREQMAVQSAARAAYGRGEIAEEQVRWADAAEHYARAAQLEPTYDALFKAREFAWRAGENARAAGFGENLIRVAREEFGDESAELAAALNEHAITIEALGQYAEAEPLFRQALEIGEKTIGTEHPNYAKGLINLAALLEVMGRYDEAEPLYRQALEIGEKTIGTEHPDYAIRLNNLALLLRAMGRHDEAEPLYRQALEIDEKTIGTAHPDYAIDLNNLAALLRVTGRHDEAGPLYLEALEIFRAKLGPDHPDTKKVEANYAAFLAERDGGASE